MHRAPTLNSLTSSPKMIILQKQDKFKDGEQNKKINMNSLCLLPSSIHNRILNAKEYNRPHTHDQVIFSILGESWPPFTSFALSVPPPSERELVEQDTYKKACFSKDKPLIDKTYFLCPKWKKLSKQMLDSSLLTTRSV